MGLAPILIGAGGALQASAQIREGEAAYAASQYNAKIAEQNADFARQQAAEEERRARIESRKQIGDMRASYASSGVSLEGSPQDVLEESAAAAELDALTIRHRGEVSAWGYKADANLERFRGKNARIGAYLGAATTLIGAGASASKEAKAEAKAGG